MHWIAPTEKDSASASLEKRLWDAADQFRANSGLKAQEYSGPIPGTKRGGLCRHGASDFIRDRGTANLLKLKNFENHQRAYEPEGREFESLRARHR